MEAWMTPSTVAPLKLTPLTIVWILFAFSKIIAVARPCQRPFRLLTISCQNPFSNEIVSSNLHCKQGDIGVESIAVCWVGVLGSPGLVDAYELLTGEYAISNVVS